MIKKKKIDAMLPTKKWISTAEACSYLDMSPSAFMQHVAAKGLTASRIGKKVYYRVSEIENLIEKNIFIKQTA